MVDGSSSILILVFVRGLLLWLWWFEIGEGHWYQPSNANIPLQAEAHAMLWAVHLAKSLSMEKHLNRDSESASKLSIDSTQKRRPEIPWKIHSCIDEALALSATFKCVCLTGFEEKVTKSHMCWQVGLKNRFWELLIQIKGLKPFVTYLMSISCYLYSCNLLLFVLQ